MPAETHSIRLQLSAVPVHSIPFQVLHKHLKLMEDEVQHLLDLRVLRQVNDLE